MKFNHWKSIIAALAMPFIAACGGNDGSAPVATQTTVGAITAFGSVIVNGIRFDDSAASVTMNDAVATRDRLRVGMVVQVRGRINADGTGVADTIKYNNCLQGPITAMNRVQNTVTVLGQTVQFDDATVFDGVTLRDMSAFAIGDQVEISCLPDPAKNQVRATRMERQGAFQNGATELQIGGTVSKLDLAAGTCLIDGQPVNFARIAEGNRPAGLANGMTVEAGGSSFDNGILIADRLRDRDRDRIVYPDGDGLKVEAYVSDFASIANFKVAGQTVNATNAVIKNGAVADVVGGVKVEVEGTITDGVLIASVVVIRLQTDVRIEAGLQAKSATLNTITLLGRTITLSADTQFVDRLANANQPRITTLAALDVGDRLEVRAYMEEGGNLVAVRVERTAAEALVVVKGPAEVKVPTTQLTLAGIRVNSGVSTLFRDASHSLIDATSFYDLVQVPPAVPTMVHARGVVRDLATNVVDATRTTSNVGELAIGVD